MNDNYHENEIEEVPLSELTEVELLEDRREVESTIISLQRQIALYGHYRDNHEWFVRVSAKLEHVRAEWRLIDDELERRRREAERRRETLFVAAAAQVVPADVVGAIWAKAQEMRPDDPAWEAANGG